MGRPTCTASACRRPASLRRLLASVAFVALSLGFLPGPPLRPARAPRQPGPARSVRAIEPWQVFPYVSEQTACQ
ncbi:MAG: hypothetical protein ACKOJF_09685, partial [Planctomycetaceae bacterium]